MTTVTLDLPQDLYQLAQYTAQRSQQPIEQVLVEWIKPPSQEQELEIQRELNYLEQLPTAELVQIARTMLLPSEQERLQRLLTLQQERTLTTSEYHEAERLVQLEDRQTLRKAKALYLLKLRNALPADLILSSV